jgi:hypothetical protein
MREIERLEKEIAKLEAAVAKLRRAVEGRTPTSLDCAGVVFHPGLTVLGKITVPRRI